MTTASLRATSAAEVQEAVSAPGRLLPRGGGSKPALSSADGATTLDVSGLAGVLEYDPGEFTFTALAGTPLLEVETLLSKNGQYLPFDPPLARAGATLGGTVAAGLNGPGRNRYGGVRDFILGVRFVDGLGNLVRGGGKVVKNSAGFDLPKLMVGSLGRLGVLVEMSFKVFPAPKDYRTLVVDFSGLEAALAAMVRLSMAPFDVEALDLVTPSTLAVRLGGLPHALPRRLERLEAFFGRAGETLAGAKERAFWQEALEFGWVPEGWALVKVPLTPKRIPALDSRLEEMGAKRRYSVAGNLAWVALPRTDTAGLEHLLTASGLPGLLLFGPSGQPQLGAAVGRGFVARVKTALDPDKKFLEM
ncbi:MAG: FAD-binding protein [Deinococcota bacterium]|nr:FAD-binding protein [Deinococcota bacterium]